MLIIYYDNQSTPPVPFLKKYQATGDAFSVVRAIQIRFYIIQLLLIIQLFNGFVKLEGHQNMLQTIVSFPRDDSHVDTI